MVRNVESRSPYLQTIAAANANLPTMAAAGIRILVEGVCQHLMPDELPSSNTTKKKKTLYSRIDGLLSEGFISKKQAESLHHIRTIGNESVHAGAVPEVNQVLSGIKIDRF